MSYQENSHLSITAAEAITGKRIVSALGAHTANQALGVAKFSVASGDEITVVASGITGVMSGAAITAGAHVTSDADGKAVPVDLATLVKDTTVELLGIALDDATAADEEINVAVIPQIVVGAHTA